MHSARQRRQHAAGAHHQAGPGCSVLPGLAERHPERNDHAARQLRPHRPGGGPEALGITDRV